MLAQPCSSLAKHMGQIWGNFMLGFPRTNLTGRVMFTCAGTERCCMLMQVVATPTSPEAYSLCPKQALWLARDSRLHGSCLVMALRIPCSSGTSDGGLPIPCMCTTVTASAGSPAWARAPVTALAIASGSAKLSGSRALVAVQAQPSIRVSACPIVSACSTSAAAASPATMPSASTCNHRQVRSWLHTYMPALQGRHSHPTVASRLIGK